MKNYVHLRHLAVNYFHISATLYSQWSTPWSRRKKYYNWYRPLLFRA